MLEVVTRELFHNNSKVKIKTYKPTLNLQTNTIIYSIFPSIKPERIPFMTTPITSSSLPSLAYNIINLSLPYINHYFLIPLTPSKIITICCSALLTDAKRRFSANVLRNYPVHYISTPSNVNSHCA